MANTYIFLNHLRRNFNYAKFSYLLLLLLTPYCYADNLKDLNQFTDPALFSDLASRIANIINIPINALMQFFTANSTISLATKELFAILFIYDSMLAIGKSYISGFSNPLQSVLTQLVLRIFSGSFFYYIVYTTTENGQNQLVSTIIGLFMYFGSLINGNVSKYYEAGNFMPGDIIQVISNSWSSNVTSIMQLMSDSSTSGVSDTIILFFMKLLALLGVVFSGIFAFLIIWTVVIKICQFIIIAYGMMFMVAFIGSAWTRQYFNSYVKYIVSLAIEFFLIIVLVSFGQSKLLFNLMPKDTGIFAYIVELIFYFFFFYEVLKLAPKIASALSYGSSGSLGSPSTKFGSSGSVSKVGPPNSASFDNPVISLPDIVSTNTSSTLIESAMGFSKMTESYSVNSTNLNSNFYNGFGTNSSFKDNYSGNSANTPNITALSQSYKNNS